MIDRAQREKQLLEMTQTPHGREELLRLYRVVRAAEETPNPTAKDITTSLMISAVLDFEFPPLAVEK